MASGPTGGGSPRKIWNTRGIVSHPCRLVHSQFPARAIATGRRWATRAEGRGRRIRSRGCAPARSAQPRAGENQREHHSGSLRVPRMLARGAEMSFLLLTIERDVARDLPLQDAAHGVPLHGQPSGETGWLDDLELV